MIGQKDPTSTVNTQGAISEEVAARMGQVTGQVVGERADAVREASKQIRNRVREFNDAMKEFGIVREELDELLAALRPKRMAIVAEISQVLNSLRDVRRFFIEEDYATERARLADFLASVQALVNLQKSGALEAIVDLMLRLAEKR